MKALPLLFLVLSSGLAAAQPAPTPDASAPSPPVESAAPTATAAVAAPTAAAADASHQPGFVVIDGFDASSRVGIGASFLSLAGDSFGGDKPTLLRLTAQGRYVDPRSGFGGYALLPFAYASGTGSNGESMSATNLGDLEVGGLYVARLANPNLGLVFRAGITVPTGQTKDAAVSILASTASLPQFYNSIPGGTTAKLGVSPMLRSGNLFARFDLGLDWNLDADTGAVGKGLHYNLGLGVDLGKLAVMAESENLTIFSEQPGRGADSVNELGFSLRATAGGVMPYLSVVIPIDSDASETFDFAATAGVDFKL